MKSVILTLSLLTSSIALSQDCFNANFVHGFNYDNRKEVVEVRSFSDEYEVKPFSFCHELPFANRIAFKTFGGGSFVCAGDEIVVLDAFDRPTQFCRIDSIKKIK